MIEADRVHSTPRITASKTNPPDQALMTTDDEIGMAWWNALTKQERAKWSAIAGNTGRPKDAWEAFRRGSMDQSPPVDPTRRHFLSQAAGGAVLALATIPATAVAAAPMVALASSDDPIFALIEEYRAAAKTVAAAASEVSRREARLAEEALGGYPFISALDMSGPGRPAPTMVYKHEHIDRLLPVDRFSKPNAEAHAALDAQIERHKAIMGDSESALNVAQYAETEALDALVWTRPTSIAGVLELLELLPELRRARVIDDDQADAIIISVIDALRDIHPNARLVNAGMVS